MAANRQKKRVGVLALQGDFEAHQRALTRAGAEAVEVRSAGGSGRRARADYSGRREHHHDEAAGRRKAARSVARVWPRASDLWNLRRAPSCWPPTSPNPPQASLGLMDIEVERNAYGRQLDSRIARLDTARNGRRLGGGVHPRSDYSARGPGAPTCWRAIKAIRCWWSKAAIWRRLFIRSSPRTPVFT